MNIVNNIKMPFEDLKIGDVFIYGDSSKLSFRGMKITPVIEEDLPSANIYNAVKLGSGNLAFVGSDVRVLTCPEAELYTSKNNITK